MATIITDEQLDKELAEAERLQAERSAKTMSRAKATGEKHHRMRMRQANNKIELESQQMVDPNGARAARTELVKEKALNLERVSALEHEAWRLRTLGKKPYQIAEIMGTTRVQVNAWLQDALAQVRSNTGELIELDRELELSRTEMLLEHYMPLALHDNVVMERIQRGDPVSYEDFEQPQRCAYICIELLKLRAKLKGLVISQAEESLMPGDVIGWLKMQREFIRGTVEAAPKDILTLEVDEPIDEQRTKQQNTEDQRHTEGLQDAL